ncbi:hypothetical protein SH661x_003255 [Planctomicrobium sp. SH661]|uniref:hypothetical protein n=1 Tax=Planctomicrobium sp. SH661 TaxID=3448124 RepID=UPI003F5B2BCC
MRRGACLLALLGMTVQTAVADDYFSAGTARMQPAKAAATPAATAPAGAAVGKATAAPQKFTRSAQADVPNDELRNYYKELFGSNPPTAESDGRLNMSARTAAAATPPAQPAQPTSSFNMPAASGRTVMPASAAVAESEQSKVVHAEFQDDTAAGEQTIQQIHAERFSARPFPGAKGNGGAPAMPGSDTATFMTAEATPPSVQASVTPTTTAAVSPTAGGRGSVSFSRNTPSAQTRNSAGSATKMESASSAITAAPAVTVEWRKQSDLNVGQECICHLIVKNAGQTAAKDLEVHAHFPESVRLVNAKPAPANSDRFLGWKVDELKAGEERTIEITMIPLQRGDINTRADVRFSGTANGSFAVAEPMLEINVEGPKQVLIGESAAQIVTVSNPGTGIASRVQIEAVVPEGLEHARGQRLQMDLGSLNPGESRSVRLALAAAKGGHHHLTVNARAESGLARAATSEVMVIAPSLTANIQGPGLRYLGRQANFVMSVSNDGEAATDNVQMRYKMPSGFDFVSADRGAQFDPASGLVTWFVGRLERGQKSEIKVTLLARQSGEFKHLARASSEHGAIADAEFMTTIEGTSSLAVQVKDLEDPVEVGSEMAYEIRVRNEGSAAAKGATLTCELADGMTLISAEGPTDFLSEGNTVVFRSLPEVGAGQTVLFKVKVKASAPGSLRFRAHLSSESVSEPLTAEEMTKFYGE